jgi:hypothetical protein
MSQSNQQKTPKEKTGGVEPLPATFGKLGVSDSRRSMDILTIRA